MNTHEQRKLSDSLLAACKAAGIENVKYIAQDKSGLIYHYEKMPVIISAGIWQINGAIDLDHPPYASDWQDSLLEWVDPQGEPLADVLARHPESFAIETERNEDGEVTAHFIRNHHGDITEMIRPDHIADTSKMIDPYKVQVGGVTLDPYMIASIYGISDPIIFQMLKKLLRFGRKHKDEAQDVLDTITSAIRWLEINAPENAKALIEAMAEKGGEKL